jgi:signal transduction histidine kinase
MVANGALRNRKTPTFAALQNFARAVSHTVRTPLAVISNDLQYLTAHDATGVAQTTLVQCRKIAAILDTIAVLSKSTLQLTPIAYGDLQRLLEIAPTPGEPAPLSPASVLFIDRRFLSEIVRLSDVLLASTVPASRTLRQTTAGVLISFGAVPCLNGPHMPRELWADRIEAILLETLVEAHGGWFEGCSLESITLALPLSSQHQGAFNAPGDPVR